MSVFEMFNLKGKRALVTGGAQGIGLCCAKILRDAGAEIIIADINGDKLAIAQAELGAGAQIAVLDVSRKEQVEALADQLGALDIVVACAGVGQVGTAAEHVTPELLALHMDINFNGVYWTDQCFGKRMLEAGGGSIVNIGSMSGTIVNQRQDQSYYNISKAAVHHATRNFAAEWASRGVRVNAVAPGYVETELTAYAMQDNPEMAARWIENTPSERVIQPQEIAQVVLFLACEASSAMTGAIVVADGGYTLW